MDPRHTWELVIAAVDDLRSRGQEQWQLADLIDEVRRLDPDRQRSSIQPVIQGMTHGVGQGPPSPCGKVLERPERGVYRMRPESGLEGSSVIDPLDGFTEPVPFTAKNARSAPDTSGVHVVWGPEEGEIVYVGQTGNLRTRLRSHLSGSILFDQVAAVISSDNGGPATRSDVADWLSGCAVAWKEDADPVQLKRRLVASFEPRFNRLRVAPRPEGESEGGAPRWDEFVRWASRFHADYDLDHDERSYKLELASLLSTAREAYLSDEPWLDLLKQAIRNPNNNLMTWRLKPRLLDWAAAGGDDVDVAFRAIWDDDLTDSDAIEVFCDHLPTEVISGVGTRAAVASLLRMPVNPEGSPVIRPQTFANAYAMVGVHGPSHPTESTHYDTGIAFCDRFIDEADSRGLAVEDRLDAQGLIWALVDYPPAASWSEQDRAAVLDFRASRGASRDQLAELVEQFRRSTGYSVEGDDQKEREREEMAAALSPGELDSPDLSALRRLAGPAYGSPGPQPGFNRYLQDDVSIQQVSAWLRDLLHGEGDIVARIERALDGPGALKGVKEAMVTKALAVAEPGRWIPGYMTSGDSGKRRVLQLLGLPPTPDDASLAEEMVDSNDRLRAALEPHFPEDPWGMQAFSWWLLQQASNEEGSGRSTDDSSRTAALADEMLYEPGFVEKVLRLLRHKGQIVLYGPPGTGKTTSPEPSHGTWPRAAARWSSCSSIPATPTRTSWRDIALVRSTANSSTRWSMGRSSAWL